MNILVLGASGMIGGAIMKELSGEHAVYGTFCSNLSQQRNGQFFRFDVADESSLQQVLKQSKPELVVSSLRGNFAQQENRHRELAGYLRRTGGRLVFLSTANVFDGSPFTFHNEKEEPYPASDYGKFKTRCERMLGAELNDHLTVVRLPRVLSGERIYKFLADAPSDKLFPLYANLLMTANTAENVAKGIRFIVEYGLSGIFHLTSKDSVSHKEFYSEIFARMGKQSMEYQECVMSTETLCKELGEVPAEMLRGKDNGIIYLGLASAQSGLPDELFPSWKTVVQSLCS